MNQYSCLKHVLKQGIKIVTVSVYRKRDIRAGYLLTRPRTFAHLRGHPSDNVKILKIGTPEIITIIVLQL